MKRVKLVVAYDGTNYHGWQLQSNAETIESMLNRSLSKLLGETIQVIGASRTDSGVHAMGNVAVFDTNNRMPSDKICFALNAHLPEDIRIQSSEEVPFDWHPRKCNCTKTYEYKILNRKIGLPMHRFYACFCHQALDVQRMREAAACLVGEHDFQSFCASGSKVEDTVRTIYSLEVMQQQDLITIRIKGNGFLYNMVRIIAGTLMRVGKGSLTPARVEKILLARDRQAAWDTAPAKGLTLVSLDYEVELSDWLESNTSQWKYQVLQAHIKMEQVAFFQIERCKEGLWAGLVERNLHRAVRNGATRIFLTDLEGDRFYVGEIYGYYQIEPADSQSLKAAFSLLHAEEKDRLDTMAAKKNEREGFLSSWYCAKPCKPCK